MLYSTALLLASCFAQTIMALPSPDGAEIAAARLERRAGEGEPYPCNQASFEDCKNRKAQILALGGGIEALAIGMQEVGCSYQANFAIGGVFPDGSPKTGDNAELGVYRNNWGMLRQYCSRFKGQSVDQWYTSGQLVHNDITVATACLNEMIAGLGEYMFFGLQRGGASNLGAGAAYQAQIENYKRFFQADGGANQYNGMAVYYITHPMKE